MMATENGRPAEVVWSNPAIRPQSDRASLYSKGNLRLTREELRYDLNLAARLAGSRILGMGTRVFASEPWRTDIREVSGVDVVKRVPELGAQRDPRPRLRIKLRSGREELFIVDSPDDASASLLEAIRRYCKRD
jgi:hypothetical protein